jgi:hypothetical protein
MPAWGGRALARREDVSCRWTLDLRTRAPLPIKDRGDTIPPYAGQGNSSEPARLGKHFFNTAVDGLVACPIHQP